MNMFVRHLNASRILHCVVKIKMFVKQIIEQDSLHLVQL